jgi:hypothetical protein
MNDRDTTPRHRLSSDLKSILALCEHEDLRVGQMLEVLENRGFGLLLVFLSLPSALPVPAPGYSTPFGIVLLLLGLQMLCGRRIPWLPDWASRITINRRLSQKMLGAAIRFFAKIERLLKPRLAWTHSRGGLTVIGVLICGMATLMILPIPLTNTLPAIVIFCLGVGMIEEDGYAILLAIGGAVVALLAYATAFVAIAYFGLRGMEEVRELVKGWLGRDG